MPTGCTNKVVGGFGEFLDLFPISKPLEYCSNGSKASGTYCHEKKINIPLDKSGKPYIYFYMPMSFMTSNSVTTFLHLSFNLSLHSFSKDKIPWKPRLSAKFHIHSFRYFFLFLTISNYLRKPVCLQKFHPRPHFTKNMLYNCRPTFLTIERFISIPWLHIILF